MRIGIVILLALLVIVVIGAYHIYDSKRAKPDVIEGKLRAASEVTTQKYVATGVIEETEGKIPLITKDQFLIKYTATVRAGFDLSEAKVSVTDSKVTVTVPHSKVQGVEVPAKSIEFIDTNFSVIRSGKKSAAAAIADAEKDAKASAKSSGLLEAADENAEAVIKNLIQEASGGREIVVKFR